MKMIKDIRFWVCVIGIVILGFYQGCLAEIPENITILCNFHHLHHLAGYLGRCGPYCIY